MPCPCMVCKGRMSYKVRTARKHVNLHGRWEGVMPTLRDEPDDIMDEAFDDEEDVTVPQTDAAEVTLLEKVRAMK